MAIPFIEQIHVQGIFLDRGSRILSWFIVIFVCCVITALICVSINFNFQTLVLLSFRYNLEWLGLGNQKCAHEPKCKERLWSSNDVSYCRLTPDYSGAYNAEVVEDQILAQRDFHDISQGKPQFTHYRDRWFWENAQKKDMKCSTNDEVIITTEGYYIYHLHTTFKENRPSKEQNGHSVDVFHQLIKKIPGRDHIFVDDVMHCGAGRCSLVSRGVVYLNRGDKMQATFTIHNPRFEGSESPTKSHFSLFMISTSKVL